MLSLLKSVVKSMFAFIVIIPTSAALIYNFGIASDRYVSESKFLIRKIDDQSISLPMTGGILAGGASGDRSDTHAVAAFMLSRDIIQQLDNSLGLRSRFGSDDIDFFGRFPQPWVSNSQEGLYSYVAPYIDVSLDSASSIITLRTVAYSAQDAHKINQEMLQFGEALVNRLNDRSRRDLIDFANAEVERAEADLLAAIQAIADFREQTGILDPEKQADIQLSAVAGLQDQLTVETAKLAALNQLSKDNSRVESIERRIEWLNAEIASRMRGLTKISGSLSDYSIAYQKLIMQRSFSESRLEIALSTLEDARREAQRKQIYLERIVRPNLPDVATEPERLIGFLATLIISLILWGCFKLIAASAMEHLE